MADKLWDEIIYPCPNFNGCTVGDWYWIDNSSLTFYVCNYISMLELNLIYVNIKAHGMSEYTC